MEYVGTRFVLAALPLCFLAFFKGFKLNSVVPGVILGITFYMGMWLQSWGMQYTTASNAAFVTGLNVIIVCVAEAIIYHKKPSYLLSFSIIVAVTGIYLMSSVELLSIGKGDFLVLLSAFFWGAQVLLIDRFSKNYDNVSIVLLQILVAGAIGLTCAFLETRLATLTVNFYLVLPHLLYLAFVCSTLALSLQIIGQRYTTPTLASLIFLLEPVFASIFSRIMLQETFSSQQMIGAGLLLLSTVIATIDKIRK
jgi:drug/metabolite transporter (DMT)-like permease